MDCSLSGFSVHGIFQARMPEWVAISSSKGSFLPRHQTSVSCIGRWILYHCATWEAPCKYIQQVKQKNQNKTAIFLDSVLLFQHVATGSSLLPLSISKSKTWWYVIQPLRPVGAWQNESGPKPIIWMPKTMLTYFMFTLCSKICLPSRRKAYIKLYNYSYSHSNS